MDTNDVKEHEIANIGNLTITVTHYFGKHSKEWRTDLNLISYADHIAFDVDSARRVIEALTRAIAVAESYDMPSATPAAPTRAEAAPFALVTCDRCNGRATFKCTACKGAGYISSPDGDGPDRECPECHGDCRIDCMQCKGTGKMEVPAEPPAADTATAQGGDDVVSASVAPKPVAPYGYHIVYTVDDAFHYVKNGLKHDVTLCGCRSYLLDSWNGATLCPVCAAWVQSHQPADPAPSAAPVKATGVKLTDGQWRVLVYAATHFNNSGKPVHMFRSNINRAMYVTRQTAASLMALGLFEDAYKKPDYREGVYAITDLGRAEYERLAQR